MNEEVKALKSELALLKIQFSERVGAIENKLNNLLSKGNTLVETQIKLEDSTPESSMVNVSETTLFINRPETSTADFSSNTIVPTTQFAKSRSAIPPFIMLFLQTIFTSLFDWFAPITKIYQSYKAKGMLGIFILTLAGIGLTLAGFGYLMQLLIDQLGVSSKALLMSLAAFSVMGIGISLKIKTRFSEFATAIVTLGILLSYSTVYFSGSVYELLPNFVILILYLTIALLCHALALWLDTKIVAALGIIGIATMPILSNTVNIDTTYYLLSFAFVVSSSLILAYRHLGQWLAHLSLAFTLVALEWNIGFENISISAWITNLFYLLFFTYTVITLLKEKAATSQTLIFLATLVGSFVLIFLQTTDIFAMHISLNFALNSVLAIAVAMFFYKVKHQLAHFFILLAATWCVLTIVSFISDAYWGIAWAVEGILLLVIGRKYSVAQAINQGQVLTAIALLYSWSALAVYFPLPALKTLDGWILSITIIAVIAIWQRLINHNEVFNKLAHHKIKPLLQLLEAVWLTVLVIASATIWLGNWTGVAIILLQLALLFRSKKCQQTTIEIFAATLILVPLFYTFKGTLIVDSYQFLTLPFFAKLALVSAFVQLWLWSAFYRKYYPESAIKHIAESVRIFFYMLIPVCWLGSAIRRFDENALLLLWLSPLLALLLTHKIKHHLLVKETKILTGLASLSFVLVIGQLSLAASLIALGGFVSYYASAYSLNRKDPTHIYQFICSGGILAFGFAIANVIGSQTNSLFYAATAAAIYWVSAFNLISVSEHLKRNEKLIIIINLVLIVWAWFATSSNSSYALIPSLFLIAALYKKDIKLKHSQLGKALKLNTDLFLHSVAAITYVTLFYSLVEYRLDLLIAPILAVHGAIILFVKDKRITTVKYSFSLILFGVIKLAMIDAANALLWQKVVLFMGIGIFILAASFWYQKLVSRVETTDG